MTQRDSVDAMVIDRIGAFIGTQALGNFVMQCLYAGSVARMFGAECGLHVLFRDDRPYKRFIVKMLRERFQGRAPFTASGFAKQQPLPLDWFDPRPAAETNRAGSEWYDQQLDRPKLFITPSMSYHPGNLPGIIALNIPADDRAELAPRLESMGVRPDGWFVALHMRELEYEHRFRMDPIRCVDPGTYVDAVRLVLDRGGQVVRIGDPSMTPLPKMPGLIDISRLRNSFELQCFIMSRARFHIGTDSGPSQIAGALKTPTLITNAVGLSGMNRGDVAMAKRRAFPDGRVLGSKGLAEIGGFTLDSIYPFELLGEPTMIENTAEDICRAVEHMLDRTSDCTGWRGDQPDDDIPGLGHVDWPVPYAAPRTETFE